jgi:hypothetical protein
VLTTFGGAGVVVVVGEVVSVGDDDCVVVDVAPEGVAVDGFPTVDV